MYPRDPYHDIPADDVAIIESYQDYRESVSGNAAGTLHKDRGYITSARRRMSCGFCELNTASTLSLVRKLRQEYKPNTYNTAWMTLRNFIRWMDRVGINKNIDLNVVGEIRPAKPDETITAADLLTKDELQLLLKSCVNSRDRAILMLLYDSAGRASETICDLTWDDLVFDSRGAKINLSGKTKKPRYVRLMLCGQYLSAWRADYWGGIPEGDAPLFVKRKRYGRVDPIGYSGVHALIKRMEDKLEKETGKHKRLHPHLFRHTRITDMIAEGFPLQVVSMIAWGTPNSPMLGRYIHLTGKDVDAAMMKHYGIADTEKPAAKLSPCQCPNCSLIVSPGYAYCPDCGHRLVDEPAENVELSAEYLMDNPEMMAEMLLKLMRK